jgi:cysteine synthase
MSISAARHGACCPDALSRMIGATPLMILRFFWRGVERKIYAKAEFFNLSGSVKDRMALNILRKARIHGNLLPDARIVEATSGNAGIALAAVGRALGHKVTIYMPDWMSEERKALMGSFGAELRLVSREEGGFLGAIAMAERDGEADRSTFLPRQFANPANPEAHEQSTGHELVAQLASRGLIADAFVAGVGTGGTVMGVGRKLRAHNPKARIHPLEPKESPTLSTGHKIGHHRIQGVSDDFIPAIVDLDFLDPVIGVHDGDAIIMAQRLSQELGLGVGISSGANLIGALMLSEAMGPDAVITTVLCDDNKKYLTTDLMRNEPEAPDFIAPQVTLLDFDVIPGLRL